jgi:acyl-CoA thioesterase-1
MQQLSRLNRRDFSVLAVGTSCCGLFPVAQAAQAPARSAPILVVGDSLSAEYGLPRGSGWVALLELRLAAEHIANTPVINASISGDTSAGGLARLPTLLTQHQPKVVIIELGGNDALRGLPLDMTESNLSQMTQAAQRAQAQVLLLGMQMPPNYGRDYNRRFAQMYARVAQRHQAALVPFFLQGVADGPDPTRLFQPDRIHPVAAAHPQLLGNVWPQLRKLLR